MYFILYYEIIILLGLERIKNLFGNQQNKDLLEGFPDFIWMKNAVIVLKVFSKY